MSITIAQISRSASAGSNCIRMKKNLICTSKLNPYILKLGCLLEVRIKCCSKASSNVSLSEEVEAELIFKKSDLLFGEKRFD